MNIFKRQHIYLTLNFFHDNEEKIRYYTEKVVNLRSSLNTARDLLLKEIIESNINKCSEIRYLLKDYEAILFHQNISRCQRMAYNKARKDVEFLRNRILIEIDFKQKFVIGLSPRQVSGEYYSQTQRSCLSMFLIDYTELKTSLRLIEYI